MTHQRRIALVSAFPPSSLSLNEYGLHLAKGFADRADVSEVLILADRLEGPVQELDLGPKVRVQRVWSFNKATSQASLVRAVRVAQADTLIFNLQTASFGDREIPAALGLLMPALCRLMGQNVGVIAHNIIAGVDLDQTLLKGQRVRQALVRFAGCVVTRALMAATYVTVTLPSFRDTLKALRPAAPVHLVPHGTFETGLITPTVPSNRAAIINTMGKFGTYKRLETLLAAFDLVRQDAAFADLTLEIGGTDHPNAPGYLAQIAQDRAQDSGVQFLGYVEEAAVPAFFGRARLSAFDYTTTTGSSGVMHQAISSGAVPIFPLIDDFADLAKSEGVEGFNYAINDAASMAQALRTALQDPARLDRLSASNQAAAQQTPLSQVIDFHMRQIPAAPITAPRQATTSPA